MDKIKALFTKDPPVSDSVLNKAANDMFTYLVSKFQIADAAHPPQVVIERVGAEFQNFANTFANSQFESVEKLKVFKDPLTRRGNREAVLLNVLPPFILCATGSISRNEMAPRSDLDLVIMVQNDTAVDLLWQVSDWFSRYLATPIAEGGLCWPFNRVDSLSSLHTAQGEINNVEYARNAATSADKNNSDLRILYRHGPQPATDTIWNQFRDALRDPAKITRLNNALGGDPNHSIGLGGQYENSVQPYITQPNWPQPIVNLKIFWRLFNLMTAPLAAANGERPIGDALDYTNITLRRLRDPNYDFDPRLQIAYLAVWEIRYRLHLLYGEEKDVMTIGEPREAAIVAVWNTRAWPNLTATLPAVHQRLQGLPYLGQNLPPFPRRVYW